ncbi:MAG: multidrug effflux MFS transporter [Microbacterium sp.]|uniref:multidrug effflux MFS transporter n=1 Tax=Microbacterium sp. TaxID=51671 RepID=UPI00261F1FEE|nr:multidrug effflux MFS transporter [Microbacterium sp.]MCX6502699.1 multidrug effflux MFS transporter [Microbacterium sp.]
MRDRLTPGLLAALGFLAGVAPLATDMYLPSFTDISGEFDAPASTVQLTLTAFLVGICVGQLFLGPLSDRLGRRTVLLAALSVFAAAGIAVTFSVSIERFILLRVVQGFAGAAGVVVARAIAADLSTGQTAVRALSLIAMVGALGPLIAPPIGGVVASFAGWRGVLGLLAAVSVAMLLVVLLVVPESLPPEARHAGGVVSSFAAFGRLLRDGAYVFYVVAFASAFAAMLAYISASPFVGQRILGMTPVVYALSFGAGGAALALANLTNSRIAPRVGSRRMLRVGLLLSSVSTLALTALTVTETLSIASFIACAFVLTAGTGFMMSNASALGLARADATRGAGSALLGSTQFLVGAIASPIVGLWGEHTAVPMALVALVCVAIAGVAATLAVRLDRSARD